VSHEHLAKFKQHVDCCCCRRICWRNVVPRLYLFWQLWQHTLLLCLVIPMVVPMCRDGSLSVLCRHAA
jgi:hypothetical protein